MWTKQKILHHDMLDRYTVNALINLSYRFQLLTDFFAKVCQFIQKVCLHFISELHLQIVYHIIETKTWLIITGESFMEWAYSQTG